MAIPNGETSWWSSMVGEGVREEPAEDTSEEEEEEEEEEGLMNLIEFENGSRNEWRLSGRCWLLTARRMGEPQNDRMGLREHQV